MQINGTNEDFFSMVYAVVRLIPVGRVTSYGAIGKYLGAAKSARMVGWAMNACHKVDPPVPAHRVVNSKGLLTGKMHFGHANQMEDLLAAEGIQVVDNQIVAFETLFWDPAEML